VRVGVIGPGAIGCLTASKLSNVADVFIVDKNKERASYLNSNGISVDGKNYEIPVYHNLEKLECDLCVVAVKAYDTESAIPEIKRITRPKSFVLTLQNGIGNSEKILENVNARIIGGVTCEASMLNSKGNITHTGRGDTLLKGINYDHISKIINLFDEAGFLVKEVDDYYKARWRKIIINSGINALSVITQKRNGELIGNKLMYLAGREAHEVGGYSFDFENPDSILDEVCEDTFDNKSSMLQDFEKSKQTEINYINGAVVREGIRKGLSVDINKALTTLVNTMTKSKNL
jgi:2-dehydropantoate 2-reductase